MVFRSRAHGRGLHIDASAAAASDLLSRRLLKPREWRLRRPSSGRSPSFLEVDVQRASSRRRSSRDFINFFRMALESQRAICPHGPNRRCRRVGVHVAQSPRTRGYYTSLSKRLCEAKCDSVRVCNEKRAQASEASRETSSAKGRRYLASRRRYWAAPKSTASRRSRVLGGSPKSTAPTRERASPAATLSLTT